MALVAGPKMKASKQKRYNEAFRQTRRFPLQALCDEYVNVIISFPDQPWEYVLLGVWGRKGLGEVERVIQRGCKDEQKC